MGWTFLGANPGAVVSGFAAIRDEINPAPLMTWLQAEGFRLALPGHARQRQAALDARLVAGRRDEPGRVGYCRAA